MAKPQEAPAVAASETVEADQLEAKINAAFTKANTAKKDEDAIKMDMINAGATFKNVARLYSAFRVGAGIDIAPADRKALVEKTLEGQKFETEEDFGKCVTSLTAAITTEKGGSDKSSASLIRAYAKKNDATVYAKPKGEGGSRNPFVTNFHTALIANPQMTEQGLRDIISALDEQDRVNPTRWFAQHNNIRKTANKIAESFTKAA